MGTGDADNQYPVIVSKLRAAGCIYAEEEARLLIAAGKTQEALAHMVDRRVAGYPLEHIIGWTEFCGLRIEVDPGVFVPRRRSEFLVGQAVSLIKAGAIVVDLCCGTGALGVAVAALQKRIVLHGVDIDPAAVQCAGRNVAAAAGTVYEGDLYEPLPTAIQGRIDLLIANAPYVPTGAIKFMPQEARNHEAKAALDGGEDGLDLLRRVAESAPRWLAPGGCLIVESSREQAPQVVGIFTCCGLVSRTEYSDDLDATVVIGRQANKLLLNPNRLQIYIFTI